MEGVASTLEFLSGLPDSYRGEKDAVDVNLQILYTDLQDGAKTAKLNLIEQVHHK